MVIKNISRNFAIQIMYIPPCFRENSPAEIDRVMSDYPLGTIVYPTPEGLDATHLPFLVRKAPDGNEVLMAHVARKNPIHQQVAEGCEVLVIFQGVQTYISPNWYPSKQETHRHVPTWDYQVVHVRGRVRFIDDVKYLRGSVALLTHTHESRTEPQPWRMVDGEKDYIAGQLREIVGLEVDVISKVGVSKLSQNREERDRLAVVDQLRKRGELPAAEAVLNAANSSQVQGKCPFSK